MFGIPIKIFLKKAFLILSSCVFLISVSYGVNRISPPSAFEQNNTSDTQVEFNSVGGKWVDAEVKNKIKIEAIWSTVGSHTNSITVTQEAPITAVIGGSEVILSDLNLTVDARNGNVTGSIKFSSGIISSIVSLIGTYNDGYMILYQHPNYDDPWNMVFKITNNSN